MKKAIIILAVLLVGPQLFAQSKKDLQAIISKRDKSIDSLIKIVENQENIIENRDRSIRILNEDVGTLKDELQEEVDLRRQKHSMIQELRKQSATGDPKIMYMSNVKNVLKVPEGKFWTLFQFMSDFSGGMSTDSLGIKHSEEVHVFLKEINGTVLTDPSKELYGPKLFSSTHPEQVIKFPLIFTAGTQFRIAVYKGEVGALSPYDGKVYCTYTEKDK